MSRFLVSPAPTKAVFDLAHVSAITAGIAPQRDGAPREYAVLHTVGGHVITTDILYQNAVDKWMEFNAPSAAPVAGEATPASLPSSPST